MVTTLSLILKHHLHIEKLIPVIEEGIKVEQLELETNIVLDNQSRIEEIRQQIYEAQILLSALRCTRL
jgi:hypothetical protein